MDNTVLIFKGVAWKVFVRIVRYIEKHFISITLSQSLKAELMLMGLFTSVPIVTRIVTVDF